MPDDVAHEKGNVDGIVGGALFKVVDEPVFGLVVDEDVEGADAELLEALSLVGGQLRGHERESRPFEKILNIFMAESK